MSASHEIDQDKLEEFMGRFVGDLGAAMSAALVVIGDRLGLYAAIADGQPITAEELASRTRATRAFSVQNRPRGVLEATGRTRRRTEAARRPIQACPQQQPAGRSGRLTAAIGPPRSPSAAARPAPGSGAGAGSGGRNGPTRRR